MSRAVCRVLACGVATLVSAASSTAERPAPEVRLDHGLEIIQTLGAGASAAFTATLAGGSHWLVRIDQRGIDVLVKAYDPTGRLLVTVDGPLDREGVESLLLEPERSGDHRIVVRSVASGAADGAAALRVEQLPAGSDADLHRLEAERALTDALATDAGPGTHEPSPTTEERRLERLEHALTLWQGVDDSERRAAAWLVLGAQAERLDRRARAVEAYDRALRLVRERRDRRGMAITLGRLGLVHLRLGHAELATNHLREALDLRGDEAPERTAELRNQLCLALQKLGRWPAAQACAEEVLAAARGAGDRELEARVLNNLGGIAVNRGDPAAARRYFEAALEQRRALGDHFGEGAALNNLGAFHRARGALDDARAAYRRALELFETLENRYWQARTLNNFAYAHLTLGDVDRAHDLLRRALPLRRAVDDRAGEATTLRNLARATAERGDLETATDFARTAMAISHDLDDRRGVAGARRLLGGLLLDAGDPATAVRELDASLTALRAMGKRDDEAAVLVELSRVRTTLGAFDAARADAAEALRLHRAQDQPLGEVAALTALGTLERRVGRPAQAIEHSDRALTRLEALQSRLDTVDERALFLATQRAVFELGVEARLDLHRRAQDDGHDRRALELSERGRSRALLSLVSASDPSSRSLPTGGAKTLDAATLDAATLDEGAIRGLLDESTVLLELFLGTERSTLWWVTREQIHTVELPPRAVLEALARTVHGEITAVHRARRPLHEALGALADSVLGPIAEQLDGQRLIVAADGALHLVPFTALPLPTGTDGAGEPLLTRHEVVHVPSASVLAMLRESATRPKGSPLTTEPGPTLAVFADPLFAIPGDRGASNAADGTLGEYWLEPLPHARWEAEAIAALLPPNEAWVALGADARRADLVSADARGQPAARARIVHFATHGLLDTRRPERSGLMLAQRDDAGRPLDGFLDLASIARLELDAELVVLSGCRTALGREIRGEGLVGVARAFMAAGAPRVVGSLWPVRDEATAELMTRFYRAHLDDGLAPAAALRRAQLELRSERRWRDPYFWAPFIVLGDWRPDDQHSTR
ncbi:MAG: CHAT domain-containing tetratricopeptide repeat protein [Acidobacteriota bacterium]